MEDTTLECLEKAEQTAILLRDDLREALRDAPPLLTVVLKDLLAQVNALHERVRAVSIAAQRESE